ncbi:MAG: molybdopterin molybdotransferase MoeA [Spirulinaceae cyanobacterium RM2_2_10]|nr:molybdopterin molybdotransferase MoeA [Spirulinaceae cyanobacterium SM2_1_0]NJO19354.1 molybdopterin molybdotransferase MoeA [Spirulinaceae cyanobacterium RM2_2_10]
MIPVAEAEAMILDCVRPLDPTQDSEAVALSEASDRLLAQTVTSDRDFPYWDNSAMDGYAVRHADVAQATAAQPVTLEVASEIPAGKPATQALLPGQAARIFTGAVMPAGADTVVMQENTVRDGTTVKILAAPAVGQFVRRQGDFYQAGQPLLTPGIAVSPADVAVLATAQCSRLQVFRRLQVAIFSTGDELILPDQALQPGQIVDSNQYALTAFVRRLGAIPLPLGIIRDQPERIRAAIAQATSTADIVLSTGGVSVGEYDFIDQTIQELGGKIHLRKVAIKPGKPLTFATFERDGRHCLYFGIPGNPVSALATCYRFVQPALRKRSGLADHWGPLFVTARSRHDLRADGKRETYLWGQLQLVDGSFEFALASGQHNSGNLINLAQTSGFAVLPVGRTAIAAGDLVSVMQI